jgi:hypothetical protein
MPADSHPNWMTEVAGILAAGILRKRRREMDKMKKDSSFANTGLDVLTERSARGAHTLSKGGSR